MGGLGALMRPPTIGIVFFRKGKLVRTNLFRAVSVNQLRLFHTVLRQISFILLIDQMRVSGLD
jgi:hypothetical protein